MQHWRLLSVWHVILVRRLKHRYVHWNWGVETDCHSQKVRHGVCLIGMEYMPILLKEPHLIANKIWPEWDFGTIMCVGELLSRRTARKEKLDLSKYKNMPQVSRFWYFLKVCLRFGKWSWRAMASTMHLPSSADLSLHFNCYEPYISRFFFFE